MKKNIATLAVTLLVLAIASEAVLWLLFPIEDPYRLWKQGQVLEMKYIESQFQPDQQYLFYPEEELSGMGGVARFTTNNLGFRGSDIIQPKPLDECRIFMVGGSTTECVYLDDTLAVTYTLQTRLNDRRSDATEVKIYGAGKSGDRSYDHLAMISQRLVHLQPDIIIVFCGINDITAAVYDADYLHLPTGSKAQVSFFDLCKYMLTEFQWPRRLYYAYKGIHRLPAGDAALKTISFKSNYREKVRIRRKAPQTDQSPRLDLEPYRTNLRSIIGVAQAHGIDLVFMTQATTWNSQVDPRVENWIWGTYKNGVTYRTDLMDKAMKAYNNVMREVASENHVPVFDLALLMPKSLDFFYDDCHFNIEGARKAGDLLSAFLIENGLVDQGDRRLR
jgi:lysophospholipase L1-like esterase